MAWSKEQVRDFAKQLLKGGLAAGEARKFTTGHVRRALIDSFVLGIVRLQACETVRVEAVQALQNDLYAEIERRTFPTFLE